MSRKSLEDLVEELQRHVLTLVHKVEDLEKKNSTPQVNGSAAGVEKKVITISLVPKSNTNLNSTSISASETLLVCKNTNAVVAPKSGIELISNTNETAVECNRTKEVVTPKSGVELISSTNETAVECNRTKEVVTPKTGVELISTTNETAVECNRAKEVVTPKSGVDLISSTNETPVVNKNTKEDIAPKSGVDLSSSSTGSTNLTPVTRDPTVQSETPSALIGDQVLIALNEVCKTLSERVARIESKTASPDGSTHTAKPSESTTNKTHADKKIDEILSIIKGASQAATNQPDSTSVPKSAGDQSANDALDEICKILTEKLRGIKISQAASERSEQAISPLPSTTNQTEADKKLEEILSIIKNLGATQVQSNQPSTSSAPAGDQDVIDNFCNKFNERLSLIENAQATQAPKNQSGTLSIATGDQVANKLNEIYKKFDERLSRLENSFQSALVPVANQNSNQPAPQSFQSASPSQNYECGRSSYGGGGTSIFHDFDNASQYSTCSYRPVPQYEAPQVSYHYYNQTVNLYHDEPRSIKSASPVLQSNKALSLGGSIRNREVTALPGIGKAIGGRLASAGYSSATDIQNKFSSLSKNEFQSWMKQTSNASKKHSGDCYDYLSSLNSGRQTRSYNRRK